MEYKVGHQYIDTGGINNIDDQFLRWINIPESGMRNQDGIRAINYVHHDSNYIPAYIILVSHEIKSRGNPWEDVIDLSTSQIYYWGDAKFNKEKNYPDFRGNKRLLQTWDAILENDIIKVPPILHFNKPRKGIVEFTGLCVLSDLQITWFEHQGKPVKNYRIVLTILDEDIVKVSWLHDRAKCNDIKTLNDGAPKSWKSYIKGNINKLDIYSKSILTKEDQLPEMNSIGVNLLTQLHNLNPTEFEAIVVELFKLLPHVSHKIIRTRPSRDGGFDFVGKFSIPYPLNYEIEFLGEVKKYERDNRIEPKHISRLVARLNRGQFGIFVTLSYYTAQAQKEIIEDNYPIRLYSGKDIVNILHELRLVDNGFIKQSWLDSIIEKM
jgi:hypothetical protein